MQGVCQQQNVLFDSVTVKEHLELYSGLKEVPVEQRDVMVKLLVACNKSLLHRLMTSLYMVYNVTSGLFFRMEPAPATGQFWSNDTF